MGIRSNLRGLNLIGLKRKNLISKKINNINNIFKKIFNEKNIIQNNINNLSSKEKKITEINQIIKFIESNIKRGICKYINE